MKTDTPAYHGQPGARTVKVGITGTGAADPVKRYGNGVTVTRTASGVYKFAFSPGGPARLLGFRYGLGADTPGDVKGHTVTRGVMTAQSGDTQGFVSLSLWSSTFAADDLQLTEYLDVEFEMSELSI